jgi:alpha-L-rhamnosidase
MSMALSASGADDMSKTLLVEMPRCEYRIDPVGVDVVQPRLSWVIRSQQRGQRQTAYRILVASSPEKLSKDEGDLWDSGKVASDQTLPVAYGGNRLGSRTWAYWKVKAWDKDGNAPEWSAPACWSMGLLDKSDWKAKWIADPLTMDKPKAQPTAGATLFRKEFRAENGIRRATAYVTGLGLYELRINGARVGDQLLSPEWTDYHKRVQYQIYDVTQILKSGGNAVGAMVGEGWYSGRLMGIPGNAYGSYPRFLLQLEIAYNDGRVVSIVTDDSWRATEESPIVSSGIYNGEVYDARKEAHGWDMAGFDENGWHPARILDDDGAALVWQRNEPIRVVKELSPVAMTEPKPGAYVYDMGQNMIGWCRIHASAPAGTTMTIRHAEMLKDDGTIYVENLRGAPQIDQYTFRREDTEVFEPHFTYHGFRYVELTGLPSRPATDAVLGRVFHSSSPETGALECSEPMLNQLWKNVLWTQRANLMSTPTDCPQRDERFGWMGDIQAFSQTAIFNMDMAAFFSKWVVDIRDDQADDGRYPDFAPHPGIRTKASLGVPAWGDAGTVVPWRCYQNYADTRMIAEHFESARRWVGYIRSNNPDLIWANGRGNNYNDWLNADTVIAKDWPKKGGAVPPDVFATAFFAHSTEIVAKMAGVLGRNEDAKEYGALFEAIKVAFNKRFVDENGRIEGDTQAGYALALNFNLLPDALRPKAVGHLVEGFRRYGGHLSTGIQSTHRLMLELTRNGLNDEAWRLILLRDFPSWGMMIENGATTIWERWDGYVKGRGFQDKGMNSFNHWAFGAVGEWMYRTILGINLDESQPAYKHFEIHPQPGGGVTWAKGSYNSIRGMISSAWKQEGATFTLEVVVPANTSATIYVPAKDTNAVTESGRPAASAEGVTSKGFANGAAVFEVESGRYTFAAGNQREGP